MAGTGTRVGPYELLDRLGAGGMGEVYRARDTRLDRVVALKLYRGHLSDRLEREAQAVAALNHPHICTLYDIGPDYLVMEYVEGTPVAGPLPRRAALAYAAQILDALDAAHARGIVHRDLKPANILVTRQGIKLLDFGIATAMAATVPPEAETRAFPETRSGTIVGTPAYMSPEQWEGKPADARTDIYAFGSVLYEMLTGTRAGRERRPLTDAALERVVRKCLANDPADRYQSAREVAHALAAAGTRSRRVAGAAVAALAVVVALLALLFPRRPPPAPLTDQDVLVVADFDNQTGEPVFDTALRQALAFQLEQSPFLKAMDDVQVRQALELSGRPRDGRVTSQIAREICVREGEKATLEGSIARLGTRYLLSLQAVNCQTGETLAREQAEADGKEQVVEALARMTRSMRARLGESLSTIPVEARPYAHGVTTTSLEALQAFYLGDAEWSRTGSSRAAIPFYQRAVEIDPQFALGWTLLGMHYGSVGDQARRVEYIDRGYSLIDRVSERERLFITSQYHLAHGDFARDLEIVQVLARTYPRDPILRNNLASRYIARGDYELALVEARAAIQNGPKIFSGYTSAAEALVRLDRLDEARGVIAQALSEKLDAAQLHATLLLIAFIEGDRAAEERERRWFAGTADEPLALRLEALDAAVRGRRQQAVGLLRRAADLARQRNSAVPPAQLAAEEATLDAVFGRCPGVRRGEQPGSAVAAALCGKPGDAGRFVDRLQASAPGSLLSGPGAYVRGVAALERREYQAAAAAFEAITRARGPNWGPEYPSAHVGLARAAVGMGDLPKARKAYEDLFALWVDADADLPLLQAARREYNALL